MTRSLNDELPSSQALDPLMQPFLQPDFDPATYLNNTIPALSTSKSPSAAVASHYNNTASLVEVSSQSQALLSKLSSQTTRLSNNLTQLTDEIVRSGGRLAYEVELLRGEAIGLSEALETGLKGDFEIFVPKAGADGNGNAIHGQEQTGAKDILADIPVPNATVNSQPLSLSKLHTLVTVRKRLDSVIKLFDEAMQWPVAPVDGATVSLISVTAPVKTDEVRALEAKAEEYLNNIRQELNGLISQGIDGETLAFDRVQQLEAVAKVWHGTSEEKTRLKAVGELKKLVEMQCRSESRATDASISRSTMDYRYGGMDTKATTEGGYGFLSNLRNLKGEVYTG